MRVNPEKKEERERVALALIRATLRLAAAHGFASLGLREVARASDIAPTSFYRHFADMEALGLALIEDLVGRFVRDAVESVTASPVDSNGVLSAIATNVLSAGAEDPELMRFILAERVGAIPSFRAALRRQLSAVSNALESAMDAELATDEGRVPSYIPDAAVVLLFEACGQALERGPTEIPLLRERLLRQLHALSAGAATTKGRG